jgi:hypothetical protein
MSIGSASPLASAAGGADKQALSANVPGDNQPDAGVARITSTSSGMDVCSALAGHDLMLGGHPHRHFEETISRK